MRSNALSASDIYNTHSQPALSTPTLLTFPAQHTVIEQNLLDVKSSNEELQCRLLVLHSTVSSLRLRNVDDCKSSSCLPTSVKGPRSVFSVPTHCLSGSTAAHAQSGYLVSKKSICKTHLGFK